MNERAVGQTDKWSNGEMDRLTNGPSVELTNGQMGKWSNLKTNLIID